MAQKYLFTVRELLALINASAAMRSLDDDKKNKIIKEVKDPSSDKAQRLYEALVKEKERYKLIDKEYIRETSKVMTSLGNEMTGIKQKYLIDEREKAEKKSKKAENTAAEQLLSSINDK